MAPSTGNPNRYLTTLSLLFFVFALGGCHHEGPKEVVPVTVVGTNQLDVSSVALQHLQLNQAKKVDFPEYLSLMGRISPTEDRTIVVPARVAGRIESVYVASGETVKEGQVLARLFSPDFISTREEYLQSLKQEKSEKGGAEFKSLARMARKKLETMGLAPNDIDALTNNDFDPDAEAPAKSKSATALSTRMGTVEPSLVVRAPRNGAIATKNATVGNLVNVGDTLFTLADLSKVWFLGDLYPEDLPKVHKDQELVIDGLNGETPLHGLVSFISPFVDPNVRSIKIRAAIANPGLELRADMYVQGNLLIRTTQAVVVPSSAIVRSEDADYVFRKSGPGKNDPQGDLLEKVKVKVGNENKGMIAVLEGLSDGDTVVTQGALVLEGAFTAD
jgi:Cu(I)/Ag(I) efflux system membrane fusion protein